MTSRRRAQRVALAFAAGVVAGEMLLLGSALAAGPYAWWVPLALAGCLVGLGVTLGWMLRGWRSA